MPSLYFQVEAPGVNILKTVTDQVVYGFLDELGLSHSFKDTVYIMSSFMASSQYSSRNGTPTLVKNRCDVEVNYILDPSQVPWPVDTPYTTTAYGVRSSHKGNHTPILLDEKAGILIEQHTVACALDMNFTLTFSSFDEATKAFDALKSRYRGSLVQTPFDLSFSYPLDMKLLGFLTSVYQAKTDYHDKTLLDYINDTKKTQISFDIRKSQLTSKDADKELMIRCQQLRCLAQLTTDQKEPDVIREDSLPDVFTLSFTLALQFGRPSTIAVHTPVSVDNTVLDSDLFKAVTETFHYNPLVGGVYQDLLCNGFLQKTYGSYSFGQNIIRSPAYDDWFSVDSQYVFYQYRPLVILHFTLDGPVTTIDLKQLGDINLHPVTLDIIKETGSAIFDYGGLFTLGVYANSLRLGSELVTLSEDLILTITSSRPDKVYHLMLSESTNLFKMNKDWDQLLVKYRYFFPLTVERSINTLVEKKYFYITQDNGFTSLIDRLNKNGHLKSVIQSMIDHGEDSYEIYSYSQNITQLADYLSYTQSKRLDYTVPAGEDDASLLIQKYYTIKASVESRSLATVLIEYCLARGYLFFDDIPQSYIEPNQTIYPYTLGKNSFYGFNTPLRVIDITFEPRTTK